MCTALLDAELQELHLTSAKFLSLQVRTPEFLLFETQPCAAVDKAQQRVMNCDYWAKGRPSGG